MIKFIQILLLALLALSLCSGSPDEASGVVTRVIDGDTIEVQGLGTVGLADIDAPEMSTAEGPAAKQYATTWLQSNLVSLDIDNLRRVDPYGRIVAVVYLQKSDGSLENFNKKIVDAGQACIWDFTDNEFSPKDWWNGFIPATACIKTDSSSNPLQLGGTSAVGTGIFTEHKETPSSAGGWSGSSSTGNAVSDGPFVGSSKSDKYHYPSCSAAKKIKPENLVTFASSAEARAAGYVPCKICHPP